MNEIMKLAIEKAKSGINNSEGGPFGAAIIDKNGEIVSIQNNTVLKDNDPTAHAEINAIREACKKTNKFDLSGYTLYTTCEPCPMCLSAIIWANIKEVYYGCTREDVANIGFRDEMIYDYLKRNKNNILKLSKLNREDCLKLFDEYNGKMY